MPEIHRALYKVLEQAPSGFQWSCEALAYEISKHIRNYKLKTHNVHRIFSNLKGYKLKIIGWPSRYIFIKL